MPQPSRRPSEASSGLGTPATRAEIIETLLRRKYMERQAKTLQAVLVTPIRLWEFIVGKGLYVIPGADFRIVNISVFDDSCGQAVIGNIDLGDVVVEIDDDAYGFVASHDLNPQKARILMQLLIAADVTTPDKAQSAFWGV